MSLCERCTRYKANQKAKRERWKAAGLCPKCGRPREKYIKCVACRKQEAVQRKRWHRAKRTSKMANTTTTRSLE